MEFHSSTVLAHPPDAVFAAYRDRLSDVVAYMDDIEAVTVLKREEDGAVVRLHNEWRSNSQVPAAFQAVVKPDMLQWDDFAAWDASTMTCRFDIKTRVFTDAITCTGTNRFEPEGLGTRVTLQGTFEVAVTAIPGIPGFLAKRLIPQVEKFIVTMIQPNLEKTSQAVGRFLDAQA